MLIKTAEISQAYFTRWYVWPKKNSVKIKKGAADAP